MKENFELSIQDKGLVELKELSDKLKQFEKKIGVKYMWKDGIRYFEYPDGTKITLEEVLEDERKIEKLEDVSTTKEDRKRIKQIELMMKGDEER